MFHPRLHFGFQGGVVEDIGQWQQTVNPVRAALPCVAVTAQPGVACATYRGIYFVEVSGQSTALS